MITVIEGNYFPFRSLVGETRDSNDDTRRPKGIGPGWLLIGVFWLYTVYRKIHSKILLEFKNYNSSLYLSTIY